MEEDRVGLYFSLHSLSYLLCTQRYCRALLEHMTKLEYTPSQICLHLTIIHGFGQKLEPSTKQFCLHSQFKLVLEIFIYHTLFGSRETIKAPLLTKPTRTWEWGCEPWCDNALPLCSPSAASLWQRQTNAPLPSPTEMREEAKNSKLL